LAGNGWHLCDRCGDAKYIQRPIATFIVNQPKPTSLLTHLHCRDYSIVLCIGNKTIMKISADPADQRCGMP